jgi:MFS family permease
VRTWDAGERDAALEPRHGLVQEAQVSEDEGVVPAPSSSAAVVFVQREGPFAHYRREVREEDGRLVDRTSYRLAIPWFRWVFALPVRWSLRSRRPSTGRPPGWAPPDRLNARQAHVLGLLAAASLSAAFVNTLFTQTVNFAADDFGIDKSGQGIAGVIVRCGIVLALPFTVLADRIGRRRVMVFLAWAAPACSAAGALAPNFWVLTASQAIGRPLGLALDLLIAVAATEEMPKNSRAYAVSVLAMASGLGAGIAVMSLPLADLGTAGWRLVYVVALLWLLVALDLTRRLQETPRFDRMVHTPAARAHVRRRRFAILATVAVSANLFVAPASFFQNRYLDDIRGYSALGITLFTLSTATPASLGFVVGGRLADMTGRRRVLAVALPIGTALIVTSFAIGGPLMWVAAAFGGFCGGIAYPAFAVYRTEMFPTARRGQAGGYLVALALIGGSAGLLLAGFLLDHGWSYGQVMGLLAVGQVVAAIVALTTYPETAHRALEELNPEDAAAAGPG